MHKADSKRRPSTPTFNYEKEVERKQTWLDFEYKREIKKEPLEPIEEKSEEPSFLSKEETRVSEKGQATRARSTHLTRERSLEEGRFFHVTPTSVVDTPDDIADEKIIDAGRKPDDLVRQFY